MRLVRLTVVGALVALAAHAQEDPKAPIAGSEPQIFKSVGTVDLVIHLFHPAGEGPHPAVVFFYGGGWRQGTPRQFAPQARYLQSRGMLVALADYRVSSRHGTTPLESTRDAKSAVRWLRARADALNIDPERIAAGGGSAGGHLAAATACVPGLDEPAEDVQVSSKPDALLLFNPALDLAQLPARFGLEPKEKLAISPQAHVGALRVPGIIFHGTADPLVPFESAKAFAGASLATGNSMELVAYEGREHGFFNWGRASGPAQESEDFRDSLERVDAFLVAQGFLEGNSKVGTFEFE